MDLSELGSREANCETFKIAQLKEDQVWFYSSGRLRGQKANIKIFYRWNFKIECSLIMKVCFHNCDISKQRVGKVSIEIL